MDTEISNFKEFKTEEEFNKAFPNNFERLIVVLFYADWHEQSKYIVSVFKSRSKAHPDSVFAYVNTENPEIRKLVQKYSVEVVPTILFFNGSKELLLRLENESPQKLTDKIAEYEKANKVSFELKRLEMSEKIEKILATFPLVIFIKGTPDTPKCDYSATLVSKLRELKVRFAHFDVLSDEDIRNWFRHYASWNTYPQVWLNQKFVGGVDTTIALIKEGKFQELVKELDIKEDPFTTANRIIRSGVVVTLLEGTPGAPKSENSIKLVEVLKAEGVKYRSFDVSTADTELINALKTLLKIENFPQLIVNKQVVNLNEGSKIDELIPSSEFVLTIRRKLDALINQKPVMLFMKGIPSDPECGFSKKVVDILKKYDVEFGHFNILTDAEVRDNLKDHSNWRTFPQLYVKGKLVGGSDIIEQLDEMGELKEVLEQYRV